MKRVLVVEDEASIREMVALNLKMAGWDVLEAESAEAALEQKSGVRCGTAGCDAARHERLFAVRNHSPR